MAYTFAIWVLFLLYRFLVLTLPFYAEPVRQYLLLNLASGLFSDMAVIFILMAIFSVSRRWFALLVTVAITAFTVGHFKYVEYFGMTVRPFHFATLETGDAWGVGPGMVLQSWRAMTLLIGTVLALLVGWFVERHQRSAKVTWKRTAAMIVAAAACHSMMLNIRYRDGVHSELRHNIFFALIDQFKHSGHVVAAAQMTSEELRVVRNLLPGKRSFAPDASKTPIWQDRLSQGLRSDPLLADLQQALGINKKWNVVLVISESLRAQELSTFTEQEKVLDPSLKEIAKESVVFTNVISGGLRTHLGQVLSQCSVYGVHDFGLLNSAPMHHATCLPDVFRQRGYDTYFFYGADNNFDNQRDFYTKHQVAHIVGEAEFPKNTPKAGWGYSDKALFDKVLTDLKVSSKPFFATVLTLSNHAPHKLPDDAPDFIKQSDEDVREKLIRYVDWTTGEFYHRLQQEFPDTVFVFIADHGIFWGEGLMSQIPPYEMVRRVARIPLMIHIPGTNGQVPTLASNVDLAPTLLTLLGWEDTPQQFMGQSIFSRQGPVYIDWMNKLLSVTPSAVNKVPDTQENALSAVLQLNLLAPDSASLKK